MSSGAFDLLDKPLVYIPVKWKGVGEADDGMAVLIDHYVEIQVEMLDDDEFLDWSRLMSVDAHRAERNSLLERLTGAHRDASNGVEGAGDRLTALQAENDALAEKDRIDNRTKETESFKRVAKAWRKIKAGGKAPPFNDENIGRLLSWPGFGTAFGESYISTWKRENEVREKNSAGSPDNGPAGEPIDATTKAAN